MKAGLRSARLFCFCRRQQNSNIVGGWMNLERVFVGIDDTDNLESRGTGWLSRQLGKNICVEFSGVRLQGVTRHQLLVHPDIPYTSHNSSACLDLLFEDGLPDDFFTFVSDFIAGRSASGSDPGICVAFAKWVTKTVQSFGLSAQKEVLTKGFAAGLAEDEDIFLQELGGTGQGIIGALAAVGLRATGNDGRFIALEGIRELEGVVKVSHILANSGVARVLDETGRDIPVDDQVNTFDWVRPGLFDDQPVFYVAPDPSGKAGMWVPLHGRKQKKEV